MVPNIDGRMGHKIKTRKHPRHRTQCVIQYPTNRNPSQSPSRKCNNCIWASVVQLVAKYLRKIESIKTKKFLELIPYEPNYVTAAGSNSILDQQHPRSKNKNHK